MQRENASETDRAEAEFKNQLFCNNFDLWNKVFGEEEEGVPPEREIDWKVPRSQTDIDQIMADLEKAGALAQKVD